MVGCIIDVPLQFRSPKQEAGVIYLQVSAGFDHSLLLKNDGRVVAQGSNWFGECDIPETESGVIYTQISGGYKYSLLLRSDGRVVACGLHGRRQRIIPEPEVGVIYTQVSAGFDHSLLLRSDGKVVVLGTNRHGECNIPEPKAGVTYIQVSAGMSHSLLLRSDGQVVAYGSNDSGQCNTPELDIGMFYTAVSAGDLHSLLLRSDGMVVACGENRFGQCNIPQLDAGRTYVSNCVLPIGNVVLQIVFQHGAMKLCKLNGEVALEIEIKCPSYFQNIMLHSHVSNFLACRVEIISPHGERLSDRIQRNPSSTLSDFCPGFEDHKDIEKDTLQVVTDRKRRKKESTPAQDEWFCSEELLYEEFANFQDMNFAGMLINHDVCVPRSMVCSDDQARKRTGSNVLIANTVMNLLCGDDTAVIQVNLWNEALASFKRQLDTMPLDAVIIMEMKTFKVSKMRENNWKGEFLTAMQQIESVRPVGKQKGTVVKLTEAKYYERKSPFLMSKDFVIPNGAICIDNLAYFGVELRVPFRGSFAGIVQKVWPMKGQDFSKEDKLNFTLIDDYGSWIQCCAMGICADPNIIAAGNRIVGFFATARQNDAKIFFLETDSTVVKVGKVTRIPCKETFIEIVGQPWRSCSDLSL